MMVVQHTPGPAYANLQGRKPREWAGRWRGGSYGDLGAADEVCDWSRGDPAIWPAVKRLMHERWIRSNAVNSRTI